MAEDTECAVCFEEYDTPKLLPCTHTFCLKCLEKLEQNKRIICPTCNKRHKVPDRGAQAFMENPHAVALVTAKKVYKTKIPSFPEGLFIRTVTVTVSVSTHSGPTHL